MHYDALLMEYRVLHSLAAYFMAAMQTAQGAYLAIDQRCCVDY